MSYQIQQLYKSLEAYVFGIALAFTCIKGGLSA